MLLKFIKPTANASIHFSKVEVKPELKKFLIDKMQKTSIKCVIFDFFVG